MVTRCILNLHKSIKGMRLAHFIISLLPLTSCMGCKVMLLIKEESFIEGQLCPCEGTRHWGRGLPSSPPRASWPRRQPRSLPAPSVKGTLPLICTFPWLAGCILVSPHLLSAWETSCLAGRTRSWTILTQGAPSPRALSPYQALPWRILSWSGPCIVRKDPRVPHTARRGA